LQNASEEFMAVFPRFEIDGQSYPLGPLQLGPGQGQKLELRGELRRVGLQDVTAGGIQLSYEGVAGALRAQGVVFNRRGFSAEIEFLAAHSVEEPRNFALRTPRFALGSAAPVLGLSPQTRFEPFLVMYNFRPYTIPLELHVGFRTGDGPQEMTIPYALPARQTQVISLHPYLQGMVPPDVSWASLEVSYTSTTRGFAAAMVSVSEGGEHSIRSVLNWVDAGTREGWYWRADTEHNTLLGIFNADAEEARVRVSLDYYVGSSKGSYELPELSIPARASHLLNVGEVVSSGIPNADGDVIPPGVTFGGYRVQRIGLPVQAGITTEALIFNHRRKQFMTLYNTGCCFVWRSSLIIPDELAGTPGTQVTIAAFALDECQGWKNVSAQATFFSDNVEIATAGGLGQVTMQAPGQTDVGFQFEYMFSYLGQCFGFDTDIRKCKVTVQPGISGPNTVWYFGGESPSGYATQIGLSSVGGHSGIWEITQGADKVSLSSSTGSQTTVSSTGTVFSSAPGDIKVRITVNAVASDPFAITSRTPHRLVPGQIITQCSSTWGYETWINYTIQDQLLATLPSGVPLNEEWTTAVVDDSAGTNWRRGPEGSFNAPSPQFADFIQGEHVELPPIPLPGCAGNNTKVQHWGQGWWIGSLTIGAGRRVQSNTLQKYRDYAAHEGIVSPVP
jgi:hypothetical protein